MVLGGAMLVALAPGSPAHASTCSVAHSDKDSGSGYSTDPALRIRTGPNHQCSIRTYTPQTELLYYECWTVGENIFGTSTWTYVHKSSAWSAEGWVSDYYLDDGGALARC